MAIAIGINPFRRVAGIGLGFLVVVKPTNKSIMTTPNPMFVLSEIIAAFISFFCRASSTKSKVEKGGGGWESVLQFPCEGNDDTFRFSEFGLSCSLVSAT
jgi:hypothetical protein